MKKPGSLQTEELLLMAGLGEPAQAPFLDSGAVSVSVCGTRVACSAFNLSFEVCIFK